MPTTPINRQTAEAMQQRGRTRMVQALVYKTGLAHQEKMYNFWHGFASCARALLDGSAQRMASHDQATELESSIQAALTTLPKDLEMLPLAEMKSLVAAQLIHTAAEVVTLGNLDAAQELQHGVRPAVELDDKHAVAAIDVQDGCVLHVVPPVVETNIVKPAAKINGFEFELIKSLRAIVAETMAYPPCAPYDSESFLPAHLVTQAQQALALYNLDIPRNPEMMVGVPA